MLKKLIPVFIALLCAIYAAQAANWVVLVSGSNGFGNYRHHSDIGHAYQIARKGGIPDENIIVMAYNDVPTARSNPFPGQMFNIPSKIAPGGVSPDVWKNIKVDYTGRDVNPQSFINVLTGNSTSGKPVLKSTEKDNVFIYFSDHGTVGGIAFMEQLMSVNQLQGALTTMYRKNMYNKLVFYLEACESGSMFEGWLKDDMRIFATTAANGRESSWGFYCGSEAVVDGKNVGSCLGDEYSVAWLEDTDTMGFGTTVYDQSVRVRDRTKGSHVQFFGDESIAKNSKLAEFLTDGSKEYTENTLFGATQWPESEKFDSRNIQLQNYIHNYMSLINTNSNEKIEAGMNLLNEIKSRLTEDIKYRTFAAKVVGEEKAEDAITGDIKVPAVECGQCCETAYKIVYKQCNGFTDYSLKYGRLIHNACHATNFNTQFIANALRETCKTEFKL